MKDTYKAKTAYQYDSVARKYDQVRFANLKGRLTNALEKRAVLRALQSVPLGSKVLDVPCGTGRVTEWLLEQGYTVDGLDISKEMKERARIKLNKYSALRGLHTGDAARMQFSDNSFDCVVSVRLLGHVPSPERLKILREFRRVSNKWVIVTYYHKYCLQGYRRRIIENISGEAPAWYPVTVPELIAELDRVGLKMVATYPIFKFVSETWIILTLKSSEKIRFDV